MDFDVIIIGAGAAGLMCAIEAGKRQRKILVLDHANKAGKKILMSGGGHCNFTNYHIHPEKYISHNPHFCKSALSRYTQWDFIKLVEQYQIPYHEKTLGQLFCNNKSRNIVDMLLKECEKYQVTIQLNTEITQLNKVADKYYSLKASNKKLSCQSLVIATGGLSIPTMGATPFGYQVAEKFSIPVRPTRAGLVPLTWQQTDKSKFSLLAGIAFDSEVSIGSTSFRENTLITHRGLSGPAILQISSYWEPGRFININLFPGQSITNVLNNARSNGIEKQLNNFISQFFPKRLVDTLIPLELQAMKIHQCHDKVIEALSKSLHHWTIQPNGTEGYRTAEVTLGGVDCHALSSKTMEAREHKGLFFIGEVIDVTGWLGGYNFQWAWSSGFAAGQVV